MRLPSREMQRPEERERVEEGFRLCQLRSPIANPPAPQILSPPQIVTPPNIPPTPGNFWNMITTEHCQKVKKFYRDGSLATEIFHPEKKTKQDTPL